MLDQQLLSNSILRSVREALNEDVGSGDITAALIDEDKQYSVKVIARESAVICGTAWVEETFAQVDRSVAVQWQVADGDQVAANQTLFTAQGNARAILTAERTALNFLQLLSGTATLCREYVEAIKGTPAQILDTRKTLPGLRLAQKYAAQCGGCRNHRIGLYDAFLIKENHIAACGSITAAVQTAKALKPGIPVEVEVEHLAQYAEAQAAGADIIMLDNFSLADMRKAVANNRNNAKLEASGNVELDSLREVAATGVDYISIGALTKHVRAIDLSMRFTV
ncbi:MAG: carboxylating nicotinate-nucleotide diphosphorylase [Pseudomonadales bacterium]|nr:carboxylating nicotinate-nucleotide diphosphorylase [Gammaproteobacteria bacterium]NNL57235.1 carboxylating nicotinate-nucleotide diphosphorylase [Pseudomonadales bacterium]